jgi:acetyltransferase-like isoleucine patch superfamily enzyme
MSAKRFLKRIVFGICLTVTSPLILAAWLEKRAGNGEGVFVSVSQFLALIPGYVGTCLRAAYYYTSLEKCSWEVHVGFGSIFTHRGASLDSHVSMGAYCVIGHADIGRGVMLASRISIPSGKRQHIDESGRLTSAPRFDRVAIGGGSWIGEGAIIMANVGENCIVSAGAVIVNELPAACLLAGNPARVIKELNRDSEALSEH